METVKNRVIAYDSGWEGNFFGKIIHRSKTRGYARPGRPASVKSMNDGGEGVELLRDRKVEVWLDRAYRAHRRPLLNHCLTGWKAKNNTWVKLSVEEAVDAVHEGFSRLIGAIERNNEVVIKLVAEFDPASINVRRMWRKMTHLSAYDAISKKRPEVLESDLPDSGGDDEDSGLESRIERLAAKKGLGSGNEPETEIFGDSDQLKIRAQTITQARRMRLLSDKSAAMVLMYVAGKTDRQIAEALGVSLKRVQNLKTEIKSALSKARQALAEDA